MKKIYHCSRCMKLILSATLMFFFLSNLQSQVQTSTKVTKFIYKTFVPLDTIINGYLESLPVTYNSQPTKKFPMIVFLHGSGESGNGSQAALTKLDTTNEIPRLIYKGIFPTSVKVNGEEFSFIVISPQFKATGIPPASIKAMIDTAKKLYRVDTSRIYLTGLSLGGVLSYSYEGGSAQNANSIAASVLVCPSVDYPFYNSGNIVATSNLPVWTLSNYADGLTPHVKLEKMTDTINYFNPYTPAKLTFFYPSTSHNAWTRAYNPDSSWGGLSVYQWMLQYTNKKLVANAGPDQAITFPGNATITLDGSKSTVRQGKITAFLWTKISGPSAGTITSSTSATTTVTSIDTGTYRFELKITHTDGSTARDTVAVSTQTQTKITKLIYQQSVPSIVVIGGYLQSLPVSYYTDSTKKFPLLIFLHALEEMGDGSQTALDSLKKRGIPKLIHEGKFPASLNVGGKDFSFITVSPQFNTTQSSTNAIKAMIDSCKKIYRVDTNRIYVTGMSQGGILGLGYLGDVGAPKTAASLLVRPTFTVPLILGSRDSIIGTSDLPLWVSSNYNDPVSYTSRTYMKALVDSINAFTPDPLTKLTILDTAGAATTDAWTKTYNPLTKFWSDSVNVYQWMLKYTRPQGLPRKSHAPEVTKPKTEDDETILDATLNPNPVRSSVTIWVTGKSKGRSSVTIYSLQGQRLAQQQFMKNSQEKVSRTFNVTGYPGGTYVVQVIVDGRHKRVLQFIK